MSEEIVAALTVDTLEATLEDLGLDDDDPREWERLSFHLERVAGD